MYTREGWFYDPQEIFMRMTHALALGGILLLGGATLISWRALAQEEPLPPQQNARPGATGENAMNDNRPLIDREQPAKFETATFGLG
jgi:hypothetical protein